MGAAQRQRACAACLWASRALAHYNSLTVIILDLQAFFFEVFEKEVVNGGFSAAQNRPWF